MTTMTPLTQLKPAKINASQLAQQHWRDHQSMQDKLLNAVAYLRTQSKRGYVLDSTGPIFSRV